jgi:hypothetical protein
MIGLLIVIMLILVCAYISALKLINAYTEMKDKYFEALVELDNAKLDIKASNLKLNKGNKQVYR